MAKLYGWHPEGTLPATDSPDDECGSAYFPALGQRVSAGDARAFATALRLAYTDIPNEPGGKLPDKVNAYPQVRQTMEYFSGTKKHLLLRFIDMCEAGELRLFPAGASWYASP